MTYVRIKLVQLVLKLTIDPQAIVGSLPTAVADPHLAVVAHDPRLRNVERWKPHTPYVGVLLDDVHVKCLRLSSVLVFVTTGGHLLLPLGVEHRIVVGIPEGAFGAIRADTAFEFRVVGAGAPPPCHSLPVSRIPLSEERGVVERMELDLHADLLPVADLQLVVSDVGSSGVLPHRSPEADAVGAPRVAGLFEQSFGTFRVVGVVTLQLLRPGIEGVVITDP